MIENITRKLFADRLREKLYHYTSFRGLLGIFDSRVLWASDVRYLNDSAEMKHSADLIRDDVTRRLAEGHSNPKLLNQFLEWVSCRITNGHILFGASFRSNGNLLSQWRSYSALGKAGAVPGGRFHAGAVFRVQADARPRPADPAGAALSRPDAEHRPVDEFPGLVSGQAGIGPRQGISYCRIPYRQW